MEVFSTIEGIRKRLDEIEKKRLSVGFVPTMGALHEGHLSLIKDAKADNDIVVASIFVNPIQFNNPEDLKKYPRNIESDINKLNSVKCDILFNPDEKEMYPDTDSDTFDFGDLDKVMEGLHRPGHFNGVAIIVHKLFKIIKPKSAYFGMKDYQQIVIIHSMTKQKDLPVEIIPCPTIRDINGLALSSRNQLLSDSQKHHATLLYDLLKDVKIQSGYASISDIKSHVYQQCKRNKAVTLEYFEIVDMYTLKPLINWAQSKHVIACIAAYVGKVRLIDNMIIFS